MNRVVTASVISVLILIAALSGFIYFNKYNATSTSALKAIPADAAFIISGKLDAKNVHQILSSRFIKNFTELDGIKKLEKVFESFDKLLNTEPAFKSLTEKNFFTISIHPTKVDDYDMIFYVNTGSGLNSTEMTKKIQLLFDSVKSEQLRNYVGEEVHDLKLTNDVSFSYAISGDIFIASYTPFLVEDALRQLKAGNSVANQPAYKKLQIKDQPEADLTIYINYSNVPKWLSVFCNQDDNRFESLDSFADWSKLEIALKNNSCIFKGVTTFEDATSFVNVFANQTARSLKVFNVVPDNTAIVKAFAMSDKKKYFEKLNIFNHKNSIADAQQSKIESVLTDLIFDEYGLLITEPGSTNYTNNCYAYFNVSNNKTALQQLNQLLSDKDLQAKTKKDNYRSHPLLSTALKNVIPNWLGKSFSNITNFYFTEINNFIFVGNTASALKLLIDAYEDKNLLGKSADYASMQTDFSTVANYFYYVQLPHCQYILKSKANAKNSIWIDDNMDLLARFDTYAFQIKNNGTQYETTAYLHTVEKVKDKISVLWAEQLDYPAETPPSLITTRDSLKFIAIQDTSHQLYLIDNSGTVVWRKLLDDKIISPILSLDLFKNGNRQLVFNTATELWILDLKGEAVANYPIKLPALASGGLAAIDFDNTLDYRIYVPCENGQLYGYQPGGKPIPRFNFKCDAGVINEPLTYFKINGADYLIANSSLGNVYVIDRNGKTQISVSQAIFKKSNAGYKLLADSVSFSINTIDTAGNEIAIDSTGKVLVTPVDYLNTISFNTSVYGKEMVATIFENRMVIKDASGNQLFAYSAPESLSGELIITNDVKGNPVYVFSNAAYNLTYMLNKQGKLVQGFPIKSYGKLIISDLNGDRMKRLILMSDSSTITVYNF